MKVIFIVPYPTEGPSTRYRVEQFMPYLEKNQINCRIRPFVSRRFYKILYKKGHLEKKIFYLFISTIRRLLDMFIALKYDIIFIHLETFPFGPPFIEYFWWMLGKTIIYDLDDAIYMKNKSIANKAFRFLKCSFKIPHIIKLSRRVIVCNRYLKTYTQQFIDESKIDVIHTAIDTKKFDVKKNQKNKRLIIGWIGSHSTAVYLNQIKRALQGLAGKYDFLLKVVGAGTNIEIPGVKIENIKWTLENDVENFQTLNIGIYPLPENEWIKGKTGFKTIQYMAVGVPCVVSSLGSNRDIVEDGKNGFLASNDKEWIEKLSSLIEDSYLREKIGLAGRKTAEEKFSVEANAPKYLEIFRKVKGFVD